MNRVLLCGVCVSAVKSLLGDECDSVTVLTSSDGTTKQKIALGFCENGKATLTHHGYCYEAEAFFSEQIGISLEQSEELMKESPGLVTLLMQNIARCLTDEGVSLSFAVAKEERL